MHKLLKKQIKKYLPEHLQEDAGLEKLLAVINDSYNGYERDKELAERAFSISEEEYIEINNKLQYEIEVKKESVKKIKEAIGTMKGDETDNNSDDLLIIARYLNQQVHKRKNAEIIFTSLITNMQSGVLLEDETRHIVFTNQYFCDMFCISGQPSMLQGADCSSSAEQSKFLFKDPDSFVSGINKLLEKKEMVNGEILELKDGRIFERDYIPIFLEKKYKGHFWNYTDITERRKAETELRKSNERWQFALEGAGDGVWEYDLETQEGVFSSQYKKMLGYSDDEFEGGTKERLRRVHPDDRCIVEQTYKDYIENKITSHQREYRIKNKEGLYLWILDRGKVISYNESGNPIRLIGTHTDITERKKAEEEYRRMSVVASANENGVVFTDPEGKIFWHNEGFVKLTGYSHDEITGRTPLELCEGPLSKSDALKSMVKAFFEGRSFNVEIVHYRKNNTWFWGRVTGQAITDVDGKIKQYFAIIENITHEKEIEQVIKLNEEKYRNIIANMNLGLLEVDNGELIQFANQSFCEMSGYTLDELVGRKASNLFVRDEDIELIETQNAMRKAEISDAYEILTKNKRGEAKWWLISGATRYDDKGELVGSIGIHLDITEQKKLELELIEARKQAESSVNAKQNFLANMSHEIRTPMNAIMGMCRQLQKTPLDTQQEFYLKTIDNASENLLVIINDILDTSKIEAGQLKLERIGFRMREVINKAKQVIQQRVEEKGLSLVTSIDDNIAGILLGDPYRLNQVLLNLLSNSIKFSEKGVIQVSCKMLMEENKKQLIEIIVSDDGIGMGKEFLTNLFQSFTQEDRSVSRKYGGTGLGMTITKNLVELMGGNITAESEKNIGTTIRITVPFATGDIHDLEMQEPKVSDSKILKGKQILLVEDNEMNRLVAKETLGYYGAIISEAINGAEAVKALQESSYDMILMDMQMPVMGGLEATVIIRKELRLNIPIIALTANAIKGENDKCIAAGMDDYISKPFKEDELVNMMCNWLEKKRMNMGNETDIKKSPLYDLAKLREISRGNVHFVKKMLNLFAEQTPAALTELQEAFRQKDFAAIKAIAHRIKPTIDNMGIVSLNQEIRQIETLASKNEHSDELTRLIKYVDSTLKKVIQAIQEEDLVC